MTPREQYEQMEREWLSPRAAKAADSQGREREETPCEYRTVFQRDRDRILHCKSFRRLKHKTQVFLSPEGDHYRTRLTHTLEVAQIARTVARALRLNEDLTEAIALGHDLGHTPFGHAGERALNLHMKTGFHHYEQSVRVVEKLENGGKGLNLTAEVRDGILCHTKGQEAATLEGRVVRIADQVAYINHDMDDAMRAGVLSESDVPLDIRKALGDSRAQRIDTLVTAIIHGSHDDFVGMDDKTRTYFDSLHTFMFDNLYHNPIAKSEENKVDSFVGALFDHFCADPTRLPEEYQPIWQAEGVERAVGDYIAGMTDNYALDVYSSLFVPSGWSRNIE